MSCTFVSLMKGNGGDRRWSGTSLTTISRLFMRLYGKPPRRKWAPRFFFARNCLSFSQSWPLFYRAFAALKNFFKKTAGIKYCFFNKPKTAPLFLRQFIFHILLAIWVLDNFLLNCLLGKTPTKPSTNAIFCPLLLAECPALLYRQWKPTAQKWKEAANIDHQFWDFSWDYIRETAAVQTSTAVFFCPYRSSAKFCFAQNRRAPRRFLPLIGFQRCWKFFRLSSSNWRYKDKFICHK